MRHKQTYRLSIKAKKSVRAISPVIATLLMIAIAVAASLVAYAWVMGYIGDTSNKVGNAVLVHGLSSDDGNLVIYVQNVGQNNVEFNLGSSIYVNDKLRTILNVDKNPLDKGSTATIIVDYQVIAGESLRVKVVTADGTFTESRETKGAKVPSIVALTLNPAIGGSITASPSQLSYAYGDSVELIASPDAGYSFQGWSGDLTGSTNPVTVTMNGNKAVTATFTLNEYTLEVETVGSGSVSKNPSQSSYHHGEQVELTATPSAGYTFSSWSGDLTGSNNPQTIMMDANKQVTATFTQAFDHFTITAPTTATAGQSFGNVIVTAYDSANNIITGFTGQVYFTSTDTAATLPYTSTNRYTFTSTDNGAHTFSGFTLKTSGSRTISVTDGTKTATGGSINISPGALDHFNFNTISSPRTVGSSFSITITAKDAYDNTVTSYTGSNSLSASTGAGTINPTSTSSFSNGVRTLSINLYKSGTGITITTVGSGKSGTSNSFSVNSAQVSYISSGAGSATTGNPSPQYPSGLQYNDLILMQVTVRDNSNTPSTPSGFNLLHGPDASQSNTARQWIFYKFATGTESGSLSFNIGGSSCKMARMYAFRNVALTSFNEGGSAGSGNDNSIEGRSITTTGNLRLCVSFIFAAEDYGIGNINSASGGTWAEVGEFTTTQGSDGVIQLQTATRSTTGTISGGSATMTGSISWGIRAFALKPA